MHVMRKYLVIVREDNIEVERHVLFVGGMALRPSANGFELVNVRESVPELPGGAPSDC
jgi:hypothetical protein